ncbi:hypothetical protein KKA53_02085 [Candidatus Dependentiae bacterium]|nr:hypothetical protein [Candidatus Dependentiae bacterium]
MKKTVLLLTILFCKTIHGDLATTKLIITNEHLVPEKFDAIIDMYYQSKNPIKLSFSESNVNELHLAKLLRLHDHIISLDLSGCKAVTDSNIGLIAESLLNLESLNIAHTNITDLSLIEISKLTKLKKLSIEQCNITDKGLENLTKPTKTTWFMGLFSSPEKKPATNSLEELNISDIPQITDKSLGYLKEITNLKKILLNECTNITNRGVEKLLKNATNLSYLDVSRCKNINVKLFKQVSDTINKKISTENKKIYHSTITDEIDFTTKKFQPNKVIVSHNTQNLFTLIHNGFDATDEGVMQILSKNIQSFNEINLSGCEQVTNKIFKIITNSLHTNNVSKKIFSCKTTTRKLTYFDKNDQALLRILLPQLDIDQKETVTVIPAITHNITNLQVLTIPANLKTNNKTLEKLFSQNKNLSNLTFYPLRSDINAIIEALINALEIIECEVREDKLVHSLTLYNRDQQKQATILIKLQPDGTDFEKLLEQITPALKDNLEALKIHRSAEGGSLRPLAKFTNLKKLTLSYYAKQEGLHETKLNDAEFEPLKTLVNLEELNLAGTDITDKTLGLITENFKKLHKLNIKKTKITETGLGVLKKLENLKDINYKNTNIKPAP